MADVRYFASGTRESIHLFLQDVFARCATTVGSTPNPMPVATVWRRLCEVIPGGQEVLLDLGLSRHAFGDMREREDHNLVPRTHILPVGNRSLSGPFAASQWSPSSGDPMTRGFLTDTGTSTPRTLSAFSPDTRVDCLWLYDVGPSGLANRRPKRCVSATERSPPVPSTDRDAVSEPAALA